MARTRSTVVLLVVASLALILWDLRASDRTIRTVTQQVVTPMQRTVTAVFAPFGAWARDVQAFGDPSVRAVSARQIEIWAPAGWDTATGRVVAADIASNRAVVSLDIGRDDGVSRGNAVLAPGGLVGEVASTTPHASVVRLVSDPGSSIGVRVLASKEIGVLEGTGMDTALRVDLLSPAAPVAVGDEVVSLGSTQRDGVPPGLKVGVVSAVDTDQSPSGRVAQAEPVAGMTSLQTLVVLTGRR